jgi:hypothetical protein
VGVEIITFNIKGVEMPSIYLKMDSFENVVASLPIGGNGSTWVQQPLYHYNSSFDGIRLPVPVFGSRIAANNMGGRQAIFNASTHFKHGGNGSYTDVVFCIRHKLHRDDSLTLTWQSNTDFTTIDEVIFSLSGYGAVCGYIPGNPLW